MTERPGPMMRPYPGKRAVDLAVTAAMAVPSIVVGVVCAVAVKADSRGPVFFRQERIGLHGHPFRIWKFRTMVDEPNLSVIPDAAKVTKVGAVLRRLSLDELPQLINVARGEMSIVGPRPTLEYQVDRYDDRQRGRLAVRPGLTGLATVRGRNALKWAERIELDLDYIARQSAALDLRIILESVGIVLSGRGVEGHAVDDPISMPSDGAPGPPPVT